MGKDPRHPTPVQDRLGGYAKLLHGPQALARTGGVGNPFVAIRHRQNLEREVTNELAPIILPSLNSLFARFEEAADAVDEELRPFHRTYAKRQLHPHLLCSPFAHELTTNL